MSIVRPRLVPQPADNEAEGAERPLRRRSRRAGGPLVPVALQVGVQIKSDRGGSHIVLSGLSHKRREVARG